MKLRRAVFLDRDGVLNANVFYRDTNAWEAPRKPEDFQWLPGVLTSLKKLQAAGFELVLVSNQPNVALGKATYPDMVAIHDAMDLQFERRGICFLEYCYCMHHPRAVVAELGGDCLCRKPSPYWLFQMAHDHGIDLRTSWMIGDRVTDTACGAAAGVQSIRIGDGMERDGNAMWQTKSLASAVRLILNSTCAHAARAAATTRRESDRGSTCCR